MVTTIFKLLFFGYLLFLSVRAYLDPRFWSLISGVNLIFHEAGHVCMFLFGEFVRILGGTLFEFGIPLTITLYFLAKRQLFATACGAWWLSYAFYQISIYAGDAQARALPLLGGDSVYHDWHFMLSRLGLLEQSDIVAGFWVALSVIVLLGSVWLVYRDTKRNYEHNQNIHKTEQPV